VKGQKLTPEENPEARLAIDLERDYLADSNPGQARPALGQDDAEHAAERCIPGDERGLATPVGVVRFLHN